MSEKTILDKMERSVLPLSRAKIAEFCDSLGDERCRFLLTHLLLDLKKKGGNEQAEPLNSGFLLAETC